MLLQKKSQLRAWLNTKSRQSQLRKNPTSDDFDISRLAELIKEFCRFKKKSNWWKEKENNNIPESVTDAVADVVRIRNMRNQMQHMSVTYLEQVEFDSLWNLLEAVLHRLAAIYNISAQEQQRKIDEVKTGSLDIIPPAIKSLQAKTQLFLQDFENESHYKETTAYNEAKTIMEDKHMVILTGHPGEGKTTMAARLALSVTVPSKCLKLSLPQHWCQIDISLKLFDTIIIDDIFGSGALDQKRAEDWKQILPEIEMAAEKKVLRFIITSRNYIFEESKQLLGSTFKGKNEHIL